ncbi:hypothetical protein F8M41_003824 [Gigaspora margarita]|uniref:Uncharacterized protein n=1 Tax=Gigaspora margarita TaxID=4874 RepID=A0A8H4AXX4_GIGMA|nr:hypothetical protein F8M41_003824 [Gigaspora margarita]
MTTENNKIIEDRLYPNFLDVENKYISQVSSDSKKNDSDKKVKTFSEAVTKITKIGIPLNFDEFATEVQPN